MPKKGFSPLQKEMMERLKNEEKIMWAHLEARETHSLTSLVKNGYAKVHNLNPIGGFAEDTYWTLWK